MPRYRAKSYIPGLAVEGAEFESDLVPGLAWEPLDKEAEAAVKARAEARAAAAVAPAADPKVAELEGELEAAWAEVEALKGKLAAFDHDGDGKPGGSAKK